MKLEDNVFNDLLASARGASHGAAAANQLGCGLQTVAASGELPARRVGGPVYVVTAGLRELAS
jgi:hypothetical protein